MRRLTAILAAIVFGALTFGGMTPAVATTTLVLDRGEVGVFEVASDAGVPVLQVRDGTGLASEYVEARAPEDVLIRIDGDAALTDEDDYEFVVGPESADELPILSWDTDSAAASGNGVLSLEIGVDGPGDVAIETEDEHGDMELRFDSAQTDVLEIDVPAAEETTWSFTEPGRYVLDVVPYLSNADGETVGEPVEYVIEVTEPSESKVEPVEPEPAPKPIDPAPQSQDKRPSSKNSAKLAGGEADGSRSGKEAAKDAKTEPCFGAELVENGEVVSDGHFDFGVQVNDGELDSLVKDDRPSPAKWRPADELLFRLDGTSAMKVPAAEQFSFLGEPGDTVWSIGQSQEPGVPWLGWNTQHGTALENIDGPTNWKLDKVEGPGELFIFQTGSFGELIEILSLADGWPTNVDIPRNTHAHGNWAFTEPGVYKVTTTHTAKLTSGKTVTNQDTLTFLVGPCGLIPDDQLLADGDLTDDNQRGVKVDPSTVKAGDDVTVSIPESDEGSDAPKTAPGDELVPVVYSDPQQLGSFDLSESRELTGVTIPGGLEAGKHKLAVYTKPDEADEESKAELVGWAPITVQSDGDDPGGDKPGGDKPGGDKPGDDKPGGDKPSGDSPGGSGAGGAGGGGSAAKTIDPCVAAGGAKGSGDGDGEGDGSTTGSGGPTQTVDDGHFDFGPLIEGGKLVPRIKDDRSQPPEWVEPSSRVFAVGSAAEMKVPDSPDYSFLGSAGDTVWMIPQTQISGVPWLGWNTQHESARSEIKGPVTFALDSVDGPGKLGVYLNDSFGGVGAKKFGNMGGFPSSFNVPLNVHEHGNWAFTEPGTYKVTMTLSATLKSGDKVSESATLTFQVGSGGDSGASAMSKGVTKPALMTANLALAGAPALSDSRPIADAKAKDDSKAKGKSKGKAKGDDKAKGEDKGKADGDKLSAKGGGGKLSEKGDKLSAKGGDDCVLPKTGASPDTDELLLLGLILMGSGAAAVASRRLVGAGVR